MVAARSLGPTGLGTITLGFAAYLGALGVHRSLLVDPLLTRVESTTRSARTALRSAVSVTASAATALTGFAVVLGLTTSGPLARGLLLFAPWFTPALAHALMRAWLYRDGRGRIATIASGSWLVTMLAAAAAGLRSTDWEITATWGLGACVALAVAAANTSGVGLAGPRTAAGWFVQEALGLGIWRSVSGVVFGVATYARVALMSSILGPAAIGGYRAIETAFAPTSLIGPALTNPGLPMMRRLIEHRAAASWSLALKITTLSTGLVVAYIVPVILGRNVVILVFGTGFQGYESLILPVAVGAIIAGLGTGFSILVLAARKMNEIALNVLLNAALTIALALPLAALLGLEAAAWGITLGAVPPLVVIVVIARRTVRPSAEATTTAALDKFPV